MRRNVRLLPLDMVNLHAVLGVIMMAPSYAKYLEYSNALWEWSQYEPELGHRHREIPASDEQLVAIICGIQEARRRGFKAQGIYNLLSALLTIRRINKVR